MKAAELVPRLNPVQKYALLYASARDGEPVRGKLWYQKGIFLLMQKVPELTADLAYEPALMGPLSEALEWEIDQLEGLGLLDKMNSAFTPSEFGARSSEIIRDETSESDLEYIEEVKELLNDLPKDELLVLVYTLYPDMTVESKEVKRILPGRKRLAANLYGKKKVGLEMGARMADLTIQEFASYLANRGLRQYAE